MNVSVGIVSDWESSINRPTLWLTKCCIIRAFVHHPNSEGFFGDVSFLCWLWRARTEVWWLSDGMHELQTTFLELGLFWRMAPMCWAHICKVSTQSIEMIWCVIGPIHYGVASCIRNKLWFCDVQHTHQSACARGSLFWTPLGEIWTSWVIGQGFHCGIWFR